MWYVFWSVTIVSPAKTAEPDCDDVWDVDSGWTQRTIYEMGTQILICKAKGQNFEGGGVAGPGHVRRSIYSKKIQPRAGLTVYSSLVAFNYS